MALEMKTVCERCGRPRVAYDEAYICSYECTSCLDCARQMSAICPNCGGELVRRPGRPGGKMKNYSAMRLNPQGTEPLRILSCLF